VRNAAKQQTKLATGGLKDLIDCVIKSVGKKEDNGIFIFLSRF
jgi:hypothetical protein